MGFSVSGAAAIVFVGTLIAFGMWYTASANSFELVTEAESDRTDGVLETHNTHVEITSATWDGSNLTVQVDNAGASQLRLSTTDLLIDGRYESGWEDGATVGANDDPNSDLWLSGETVDVTVSLDAEPDRVKVVTETGVSDTSEVSVV